MGFVVVAHGLSCPAACEIFPDQGLNTCPPALVGFFTTEPPGKSHCGILEAVTGICLVELYW